MMAMDLTIPNFTLDGLLHTGKNTLIYRAIRDEDKLPVVLKITRAEYPSANLLAQLKHEMAMLQRIRSPRVVQIYNSQYVGNRFVLVLENCDGRPLDTYIKNKQIDIETALILAIEIAQGMGDIHHHHIIHKDIKPHNIIVNPETNQVKIIDFGIATLLSREMKEIISPELMEGTFAYISPEQTGRINSPIDYRTDIYSLGITLYEMFTEQLPFKSKDFMELIHQHIAKQPIAPHIIEKYIPIAISDIIMKCIAKGPEERYNSAYGLKNDLENCFRQLKATRTIKPFVVGRQDIFDQFHIPQKLYGRDREVETLLSAFERSSKDKALLVFVKGYAGIGKSSLVNAIQRPIAQKRGFFVSGKFEQFKKNIPYSALIQAFTKLVKQILAESDATLAEWKERLLKALGENGQIMIQVIPELELIIGIQPIPISLERYAEELRFKSTFASFFETFLHPEHPVVMFLDDLQWADSASLQWLKLFFSEAAHHHLLVIGAYRDNEVDNTHPLALALREIVQAGQRFEILEIPPLNKEAVEELIQDTLHDTKENASPLAHLVHQKTQGNPFFIIQFLKMLYEKQLLNFDPELQRWEGNLSLIQRMNVTDNVANFMSQKIREFPAATQSILKVAAAIGNTFDINLITKILGVPFAQVITDLWIVIETELIISHQNFYALERIKAMTIDMGKPILCTFQHDRIQQAAFQLIDPEEKIVLHYTIGRTLLMITPEEKLEEQIITIVNHLNYGIQFIRGESEQIEFAQLNLQAGKKASRAAAYPAALSYFTTGISCLPKDSWEKHYSLTYTLYENLAMTYFLVSDIVESEKALTYLTEHVKTDFERGKIYYLHTRIYLNVGNVEKAKEAGIKALNLLGEKYTLDSIKSQVFWEKIKLKFHLLFKNIEQLSNLPRSKNEADLLIDYTFSSLQTAMRFSEFSEFNMLKALNRTMRSGITEYSTYTFSRYGAFLALENVQKYKLAYQAGVAASAVARDYNVPESPNIKMFTEHWGKHYNRILPEVKETADRIFALGLIEISSQYLFLQVFLMLMKGDGLDKVLDQLIINKKITTRNKSITWCYVLATLVQVCRCLQGLTLDPTDVTIEEPDPLIQNYIYPFPDLYTESWPTFLLYIHERYEAVVEKSKKFKLLSDAFPSGLGWVLYYFYHALTIAALYPESDSKTSYWKILKKYKKHIQKWAIACPENHLHQYFLFSAEMSRCANEPRQAMALYNQAIETAYKNEFLHEEALAYELAAKFLLSLGRTKRATFYLLSAYNAYFNWGAKSKLRQLEEKYHDLLNFNIANQYTVKYSLQNHEERIKSLAFSESTQLKTIAARGIFDSIAILQAAQALSDEIVLDRLLTKLMNILSVIAGAGRALLILQKDAKLTIHARLELDQTGTKISLEKELIENTRNLLCTSVVYYVMRNRKELLLHDATNDPLFMNDPYIITTQVRSILCIPLLSQNRIIGILYLENRVNKDAFKAQQIYVLSSLSLQLAASIENALFYANLEANVEKDTEKIKTMEHQLILKEKMIPLNSLSEALTSKLKIQLETIEEDLAESSHLVQNIEKILSKHLDASLEKNITLLKKNIEDIKEQEQQAIKALAKTR